MLGLQLTLAVARMSPWLLWFLWFTWLLCLFSRACSHAFPHTVTKHSLTLAYIVSQRLFDRDQDGHVSIADLREQLSFLSSEEAAALLAEVLL